MYADGEALRAFRGVRPEDLGVNTTAELDALLNGWAEDVKGLIDESYTPPRDFLDEAGGDIALVPRSVRSVALRALSNYVSLAQSARESDLVRIDEWRVTVEQRDQIHTPTLRRDLPRRAGSGVLRGFVAHGADDV